MNDPRLDAVRILEEILENRTFFNDAKASLDSKDQQGTAFINMLVLTSLRHLVFIRKTLKTFMKKKLPEKVAFANFALIAAATEILYLDTPDYAVINSYVDLVKKYSDKYVGGFVNAVLRRLCEHKNEIIALDKGEFFTPLFFELLNLDYNKKTVQKIQAAALMEPPLDITAKANLQIIAEELNGELMPSGTIRLSNDGHIIKLKGYNEGSWWVQDLGASLAVKALGDVNNLRVLDLCAAPGGKTAQLLSGGASVTALDVSASRLTTLQSNLDRLKLKAQDIICADAFDYLKNYSGPQFDAIVMDAPCSATGTIRRHPEIVHIKNLKDVEKMAVIQKGLLAQIGKHLKPGGTLIYCVCSISKLEGEYQIKAFLEDNSEFANCPLNNDIPEELADILTPEGFIRTLPFCLQEKGGMDSFFIAKLKKAA